MSELYTDGGVIVSNPSPLGGMYAFCLVENDKVIHEFASLVIPGDKYATDTLITNNLTEFLAVCKGLALLPDNWTGTVYSDSQVTLGRVTGIYQHFNGIPYDLKLFFVNQKRRLNDFERIKFVLVGGHPTLKELSDGKNRKGIPVSKYNVWCDKACQALAKKHLERINQ